MPVAKDVYIYTSNLNFVSTHLSKPGHRCGCCCMSPRCLLRQFVDRCLLSWALFIEKTVLLCFARFCPNGGKQRCGCSQMRHKLVRAVRLLVFVTAIEETACFVLLKVRATRRFRRPSVHILHVRCQFCVIRAVTRNLQFLPV